MYTKIEKQEMIEKAQKLIAQAVELVDEAISEDQNLDVLDQLTVFILIAIAAVAGLSIIIILS